MNFRISHKLMIAFGLTSLLAVASMVLILNLMAARNFEAYIHGRELAKVKELVPHLISHYQEHGGWRDLYLNRVQWHLILRAGWSAEDGHQGVLPSPPRLDRGNRPGPPPPRFGPQSGQFPGPPGQHPPPRSGFGPGPNRQPGLRKIGPVPPAGHPLPWDDLNMVPRLSLFNAQGEHVCGHTREKAGMSLTRIEENDRTLGWIGLRRGKQFAHPLDREFVRKQSRAYYLVGGGILIVSLLVGLLLARFFAAPIRRLAAHAEALKRRQFGSRLKTPGSDELGDLARDFNELAKTLGRYEKLQKQWLSDISHELRTPLAVLRGEIEALQDGVRRPDPESLGSLQAEVAHIQALVDDLHGLALAESGRAALNLERLDLGLLLDQVLAQFEARFERAGMSLGKRPESGPEIHLNADPKRLVQLLTNLLENALRHADRPGRLVVGFRVEDGQAIIEVEDSGPGVAEAELPRLFDRLYRTDRSRSRTTGGSGLGLAICKAIAEGHGGSIRAEQGDLGGLLIRIDLPLKGPEWNPEPDRPEQGG